MAYLLYIATAFLLNLPFGAWRETTRKFSLKWFAAIHLPIPIIIAIRIGFDISLWIIPVGFAVAFAGQMVGGKIYLSRTSKKAAV